jgi:hypothetical protein
VGIKEADLPYSRIPVMTKLTIQIEELYHVGDYAVFQGKVSSELAFFCKTILQVMEPEEETLSNIMTSQRVDSWEKERGNGGL